MATVDISAVNTITRTELVTVNEAVVFTVSAKGAARITVLFEANAGRLARIGVETNPLAATDYAPIEADRYFTFFVGVDSEDTVFYLEPLTGNTFAVVIVEPKGA